MFRRALVAAAGVGVTIALTLTSGSAIASPVTAEKPDPAVSKSISKAAQEKTKDYWTSSRMKNAKSGDLLVRDRSEVTSDSTVAKGEPTVVRGSAAKPAGKKPQALHRRLLHRRRQGRPDDRQGVLHAGRHQLRLLRQLDRRGQQQPRADRRALPQRRPRRVRDELHLRPRLRRRRRPVRPVRRGRAAHLHAVGQPGRPQLRHRLRGGRHVRRLDPHRRGRCPGRRVQPRPQRHDVRLRLPGRVPVRRLRHRLVQRAGRGRHLGRQLRPRAWCAT